MTGIDLGENRFARGNHRRKDKIEPAKMRFESTSTNQRETSIACLKNVKKKGCQASEWRGPDFGNRRLTHNFPETKNMFE